MSAAVEEPTVVRSYQRIFRPDRRIYQVDGRTLPIPGGIPLRWLGWALFSLLAGMLLASGTRLTAVALAGAAGLLAVRAGRARLAPALGAAAVLGCVVVGEMMSTVDWPMRLIVMPALVATVMTQVTPDGRAVHRYLAGWVRARLQGWRSIGESTSDVGPEHRTSHTVRVAPDEHTPILLRARIDGPAMVMFARPVWVRRGRRARVTVRPLDTASGARGLVLDDVRLAQGERLMVRP